MKAMLCSHCGMGLDGHEAHQDRSGKTVCMFCTSFGDNGFRNDEDWRTKVLAELGVAFQSNPFQPYQENPGAVPGDTMYVVHGNELDRFLALNNFLLDLFKAVYSHVPKNTTAQVTYDSTCALLRNASLRAQKHFKEDMQRVPLYVVDGAIEQGGNDASAYLTIIRTVQANYSKFQRTYYETRSTLEEMKKAQREAPMWFAMIGHMAMHGSLGKGRVEGYDRWQRGQDRPPPPLKK